MAELTDVMTQLKNDMADRTVLDYMRGYPGERFVVLSWWIMGRQLTVTAGNRRHPDATYSHALLFTDEQRKEFLSRFPDEEE